MDTVFERSDSIYVISEIGINHNGNLDVAKNLIEESVRAGVNAVKFQVRNLEFLYTADVLLDSKNAEQGTQYLLEELKRAHLSYEQIEELYNFSKKFDIDFFATPFDIPSARFLKNLGMSLYKIGSPDFTNIFLLEEVASYNKPMILSTGMSNRDEIIKVSSLLNKLNRNFSLLHCNSTYPANPESTNLKYMSSLGALSGNGRFGYSGHEKGIGTTLAAVALGASIIERHITMSQDQEGPDHSSSLTPYEFKTLIDEIRNVELSLGENDRTCSQGEKNNRISLSKSLVASRNISAGSILVREDFLAKSPAKGVSPLDIDDFIGRVLTKDMSSDDYFQYEALDDGVVDKQEAYEINKTWGIVGRLNDFRDYLDLKPDLVEMHMTWRDLVDYSAVKDKYSQDLVVHAPEYYEDKLIDFTSDDSSVVEYSLEMLRKTIEIARDLNASFVGQTDIRGPRVVVHPGGHFKQKVEVNKNTQYKNLLKNLKSINSDGVRILVENMPPLPWYFGGQWYNTVFLDAKEIAQFANEIGWGVCFDVSHAQLYCNYADINLIEFSKTILNNVEYLHISDAAGVSEEGLQIGKGNVDFEALFTLLGNLDVGFIPEIWQGHLNKGKGFKDALSSIEKILKKVSGDSCHHSHHNHK